MEAIAEYLSVYFWRRNSSFLHKMHVQNAFINRIRCLPMLADVNEFVRIQNAH